MPSFEFQADALPRQRLGKTDLVLSRLGFGSLVLGHLQAHLPPERGAELISHALKHGVNWIDTAHLYETYEPIRLALRQTARAPIICSKTYAYSRADTIRQVDYARSALDLDHIDLFLLHEQESAFTLHGHREAFACLLDLKAKGVIGAVGISTHAIEAVTALTAARLQQPHPLWEGLDPAPYRDADVVFALLNPTGIGLLDGTAPQMAAACDTAAAAGLGVLGMKVYAGGHLLSRRQEAVQYALAQRGVCAYAVGLLSEAEITCNLLAFSGQAVPDALWSETAATPRHLQIADWCSGCGACVARCKNQALALVDGQAVVDRSRCILCSYCAAACRDFAIKIV